MSEKTLVIGGTRFFGKRLVRKLLDAGHAVTLLTRGQAGDPFGGAVTRLTADRCDRAALEKALKGEWDTVYDQVGYAPDEAIAACQILNGRVGRYIFTSSALVYDPSELPIREDAFQPESYPIRDGKRGEFSYQEGKRLMEAVFAQRAPFPCAMARFPVVLGEDDYTGQLNRHAQWIQAGTPFGLPHPGVAMSFINSEDAAEFLYRLPRRFAPGPVNAAADGQITVGALIGLIEARLGVKAQTLSQAPKERMSSFSFPASWPVDNTLAKRRGFAFAPLQDWLPGLIERAAQSASA